MSTIMVDDKYIIQNCAAGLLHTYSLYVFCIVESEIKVKYAGNMSLCLPG